MLLLDGNLAETLDMVFAGFFFAAYKERIFIMLTLYGGLQCPEKSVE